MEQQEILDTVKRIEERLNYLIESLTEFKTQTPLTRGLGEKKKYDPWPEFKPKTYIPKLTGEIVDQPETREVDTRDGPTPITNFRFTDGVTTIRVGLWAELGNAVNSLMPGDEITLTAMSVREPYDGVIQVSSTRKSTVE